MQSHPQNTDGFVVIVHHEPIVKSGGMLYSEIVNAEIDHNAAPFS